jgi:hypothetical protein
MTRASAVPHPIGGSERVLGVAAQPGEGHDALARVLPHPDDLAAGHDGQLGLGDVRVLAGVGVGVVHPRPGDADEDLVRAGRGDRDVDEVEHLGSAELDHLDRAHRVGHARHDSPARPHDHAPPAATI